MTTFSAQIDAQILKCKTRLEAVVRTSLQTLVDQANLEGPSVARPDGGRGGRMPVDVGFLMNSIAAAIGSVPSGPSKRSELKGDPDAAAIVIANMKIGETLYIGWTAEYARAMEARYGFRDAAAQKWPQYVAEAVAETKRRIP